MKERKRMHKLIAIFPIIAFFCGCGRWSPKIAPAVRGIQAYWVP